MKAVVATFNQEKALVGAFSVRIFGWTVLKHLWQDWGEETPQFPTWTESIWKTIGARMFLKGSTAFDQGIFSLGIVVFCVSFVTTYWLNKHASIIFQTGTAIEIDNPVPVEM